MSERRIVVVGAGIGGLTAALALARAGFHVILCERASALSELGAGIQLSPNAMHVLGNLGLAPAIREASVEPRSIEVRSGKSGRPIMSIPVPEFSRRYGAPYCVIHRADLQAVLAHAVKARPDIELILGATIGDARLDASGVSIAIESEGGSQGFRGSALIAADGVWSTLRELVDRASRPRPAGRTAWRAMIAAADSPLGASSVGLWLGAAAHLVHYPVAKGDAVNIVAIVEEEWREEGWNAAGDGNWLLGRFASWCESVRRMIAAPADWRKFGLASVDAAGPWVKGPIALLGDAAHAMMPFMAQGAAMAIEDAAVLAAAFTAAGDDVPAGLRAYEAARRPRVTRVAEAARQTGEYFHWNEPRAGIRNAMLRLIGPSLILARSDWIYDWKPAPMEPGVANPVPDRAGLQ